ERIAAMCDGDVLILKNTRFYKGVTKNDPEKQDHLTKKNDGDVLVLLHDGPEEKQVMKCETPSEVKLKEPHPEDGDKQKIGDVVQEGIDNPILMKTEVHANDRYALGDSESTGELMKKYIKCDPHCNATEEQEEAVSASSDGNELALKRPPWECDSDDDDAALRAAKLAFRAR
ncbi:unnamed protein product, partial [Prorocentrum cordatum]